MKKRRNSSQIATIIVFIMAVVFLFTLISINIGKVAQKKTIVDNVADSMGLAIASQISSIANALKYSLGIWGANPGNNICNVSLDILLGILFIALAVIAAVCSGGAGSPLVGIAIAFALSAGVRIATGGIALSQANDPNVQREMRIKFQSMSQKQQTVESAIQGVLFALVDDPAWVKDTADMDKDLDHNDEISRFLKWYNLRLDKVPQVGTLVKNFLTAGYLTASDGYVDPLNPLDPPKFSFFYDQWKEPRFDMVITENWVIDSDKESVRWWLDSNNRDDNGNGNFNDDHERDSPPLLKLADWITSDDGLAGLLKELRSNNYGYEINVSMDTLTWTDENGKVKTTQVPADAPTDLPLDYTASPPIKKYEEVVPDYWKKEIEEFETSVVRALHDLDYDSLVSQVDFWLPYLKNNEPEPDADWYRRFTRMYTQAVNLRAKLKERMDQINECVYECKREYWFCEWSDGTDLTNHPKCNDLTTKCCSNPYSVEPQCVSKNPIPVQCRSCTNPAGDCCKYSSTNSTVCDTKYCQTTAPTSAACTDPTTLWSNVLTQKYVKCDGTKNCTTECYVFDIDKYDPKKDEQNPLNKPADIDPRTGVDPTQGNANCQYKGCCGPMIYCGEQCENPRSPTSSNPPKCPVMDNMDTTNYAYNAKCINTGRWPTTGITLRTRCESPIHNVGEVGAKTFCCNITELAPYDKWLSVKESHNCYWEPNFYGPKMGKWSPVHNIVKVYPFKPDASLDLTNAKGIKYYDSLWVLDRFIEDLLQMLHLMYQLEADVTAAGVQGYNNFHEAFYVWSDFLGGVSGQKQRVSHIVYAMLELPNGPNFKLPYPHSYSEWISSCVAIKEAEGSITLTVGRWDQSTATTGVLGRFRNFVFSKLGIAPDIKAIEQAADDFNAQVKNNAYTDTINKAALKTALRNGQVTKVKVHYGPGYTYEKPEDVDPNRKNEDIYIESTQSAL